MKGHDCDNCGHNLSEEEYASYGSWSYTCANCGFTYNHNSELTISEQIDGFEFDNEDFEEDED